MMSNIQELRTQLNTASENVTRLQVQAEQAEKRKDELEEEIRELGLDPNDVEAQSQKIVEDAEGVVKDVLAQVNEALEATANVG